MQKAKVIFRRTKNGTVIKILGCRTLGKLVSVFEWMNADFKRLINFEQTDFGVIPLKSRIKK